MPTPEAAQRDSTSQRAFCGDSWMEATWRIGSGLAAEGSEGRDIEGLPEVIFAEAFTASALEGDTDEAIQECGDSTSAFEELVS
jgi:hypothetical protein